MVESRALRPLAYATQALFRILLHILPCGTLMTVRDRTNLLSGCQGLLLKARQGMTRM